MGRAIGAFFILPGIYFVTRGYVTATIRNRLLLIGTLIGGQGLLGWYMVQSGLDEEIVTKQQVPRVSQYRLASHFGSAILIYSACFLTALGILLSKKPLNASVAVKVGLTPLVLLLLALL